MTQVYRTYDGDNTITITQTRGECLGDCYHSHNHDGSPLVAFFLGFFITIVVMFAFRGLYEYITD